MKKSYPKEKRTTLHIDPEIKMRIDKILKNKGSRGRSKYAKTALEERLDEDERKQILDKWNRLGDSAQYQKIKQLEGEVEKLKEYHITEKKTTELFKKLKSKKIDDLEKRLVSYESVNEYIIHHYLPTIKKNVKEYKKWLKKNE